MRLSWRLRDRVGSEVYVYVFGAVLPPLTLREIQASEEVKHPAVLAHDEGVQTLQAVLAGGLDQTPRQPDAEPPTLERRTATVPTGRSTAPLTAAKPPRPRPAPRAPTRKSRPVKPACPHLSSN